MIGIPSHGGLRVGVSLSRRAAMLCFRHSELRAGNSEACAREGSLEAKHLRKALESLGKKV